MKIRHCSPPRDARHVTPQQKAVVQGVELVAVLEGVAALGPSRWLGNEYVPRPGINHGVLHLESPHGLVGHLG